MVSQLGFVRLLTDNHFGALARLRGFHTLQLVVMGMLGRYGLPRPMLKDIQIQGIEAAKGWQT